MRPSDEHQITEGYTRTLAFFIPAARHFLHHKTGQGDDGDLVGRISWDHLDGAVTTGACEVPTVPAVWRLVPSARQSCRSRRAACEKLHDHLGWKEVQNGDFAPNHIRIACIYRKDLPLDRIVPGPGTNPGPPPQQDHPPRRHQRRQGIRPPHGRRHRHGGHECRHSTLKRALRMVQGLGRDRGTQPA